MRYPPALANASTTGDRRHEFGDLDARASLTNNRLKTYQGLDHGMNTSSKICLRLLPLVCGLATMNLGCSLAFN